MSYNLLWLVTWYPNKLAPFDGDFIQRHARAVSLINRVVVVFIKKDEKGITTKNVKEEITETGNLTEVIVYYHPLKTGIKLLDRLLSRKKYNSTFRKTISKVTRQQGVPDLIHVHVILKVIRHALWLKKKYSIPLLISEHWTGYLPEAKPNVDGRNIIYKKLLQKMFNKADAVTVVSNVLGKAIKSRFKIEKYHVIPNVVDTDVFFPIEKNAGSPVTKFIHISLLNSQKNFQGIIEAFSIVKKRGHQFQLTVVGPGNIRAKQSAAENNLQEQIIFKQEVPQNILAKDMQEADALILYSRYETFGCVVIEANACGVPAILSDLPVFHEYVIENKTGVYAKSNDPASLAETIANFIQRKNSFSQTEIADYTKSKFGYEVIAKQFNELYKTVVNKA
jgi:glycosyltransferase involved in cell wall biosynthesis